MALLPPAAAGLPQPPQSALDVLRTLEEGLDDKLPQKANDNLLVATWNIAHLARVTKRWQSGDADDPKRNLQDLCCIATVISHFDVVAVVEIKRDLTALRLLTQILGKNWAFIVSDVVEGTRGNSERLGYLFDLDRVKPSGLAGELVIPDAELTKKYEDLKQQFARTPYTVSFRPLRGDKGFTLVSLHIWYGTDETPEERTPELRTIAKWMHEHADDPDEFNRNMIALGDFNIDRNGDPNWQAFVVEYGLSPPDKLLEVDRTVAGTGSTRKYYDQIAWFNKGKRSALTLKYKDAGGFKWTDYILKNVNRDRKEARISDHYPLWAEFDLG